jgi:AraC-like DNA-binding protein
MKNIRPIYSQDPDIRVRKLRIRRLRLNRHLPEANWIADHSHSHPQILLYLGGAGLQKIGSKTYQIKSGMLFFIPPHVRHSFIEGDGRRPLCLALDFDFGDTAARKAIISSLTASALNEVRSALSQLTRWRAGDESVEPAEAAAVLRMMDVFFRSLGFLTHGPAGAHNPILRAAQRVLYEPSAFQDSLASLAARIGYHPDYLNRTLKQTCGLTLGDLRDELRMQKAKRLLAGTTPVAEVSGKVGFDDPNYFSRWFRGRTGHAPSAWRSGQGEKHTTGRKSGRAAK